MVPGIDDCRRTIIPCHDEVVPGLPGRSCTRPADDAPHTPHPHDGSARTQSGGLADAVARR